VEKHRLEELKKMSLEELKAISRPLEVGEVIQEGDFSGQEFACASIGLECSGAIKWYRPTDKPTDEIKLGWYRSGVGFLFRIVFSENGSGLGYWEASGNAKWWHDFTNCEYIGTTLPEPGEWADPGEVKSSELPIRARFRDVNNDKWEQGELTGFSTKEPCFEMNDGPWMFYCQVWRPSK